MWYDERGGVNRWSCSAAERSTHGSSRPASTCWPTGSTSSLPMPAGTAELRTSRVLHPRGAGAGHDRVPGDGGGSARASGRPRRGRERGDARRPAPPRPGQPARRDRRRRSPRRSRARRQPEPGRRRRGGRGVRGELRRGVTRGRRALPGGGREGRGDAGRGADGDAVGAGRHHQPDPGDGAGDDDAVPLEHTLALYRGIADSALVVVPGTSHFLVQEKPALCNAIIVEFLTTGPVPTVAPIRRATRPRPSAR